MKTLSSKKSNLEIEILKNFSGDVERKGSPMRRKVRIERGRYPVVSLPIKILKVLGLVSAADVKGVYVEYEVVADITNPFASEIKLKFHRKTKRLPHELEESGSKSKGEKKPT